MYHLLVPILKSPPRFEKGRKGSDPTFSNNNYVVILHVDDAYLLENEEGPMEHMEIYADITSPEGNQKTFPSLESNVLYHEDETNHSPTNIMQGT